MVISASDVATIARDAVLFSSTGLVLLVCSAFLLSIPGGAVVGLLVGVCSVIALCAGLVFTRHYWQASRDNKYCAIIIGPDELTLNQLGISLTLDWQQIESIARVDDCIHPTCPSIGIRLAEINLPLRQVWKTDRERFGCDVIVRLTPAWSTEDLRKIDAQLISRYPKGASRMTKGEKTRQDERRLVAILAHRRKLQATLLIFAIPIFVFLLAAIQSPKVGAIYARLIRGPEVLVNHQVQRIVLADLNGGDAELLEKTETVMEHLLSSEVEITATPLPEAAFPPGARINTIRLRKYLAAHLKPTNEERVFAISSDPLTHTSEGSGFVAADPASPIGAVSIHGVNEGASGQPALPVKRTVKLLLNALGISMGFHPEVSRGCVMGLTRSLIELDERGDRYCGKHVDHLHFLGMLH